MGFSAYLKAGVLGISAMRVVRVIVFAALVFLVPTVGFGGEETSKQQALDDAYAAGILSKEEYAAKKAAVNREDNLEKKVHALDAARAAGIMTESEYQQKKAALVGAGVKPAADKSRETKTSPFTGAARGRIFRHPTGISLWYPDGWQAQMLSGILQLVAPVSDSTGKTYESYFVTAEHISLEGIRDINTPEVIAHIEELIQSLGDQLGLYFQRTGNVVPVATANRAGKGIEMNWQAQSQIGVIQSRAYACIIKQYWFVIAGVGSGNRLQDHRALFERIFRSLGVGEGKKDPALVGRWRFVSTNGLRNESVFETDYSRAKMASENQATIQFSADGTVVREDRYEMVAGAGGVWMESKDRQSRRGKWNADGKTVFIIWQDQSFNEFLYRIEDGALKLVEGKKVHVWCR